MQTYDERIRTGFRYLNKYFMVPVFRMGLGAVINNPLSGYIMVLNTVGRKTGLKRYAPVNYAIHNGVIYCLAGFGTVSHWYRNLKAHPEVEIILADRALYGAVEEVEDPGERLLALRLVLQSAGFAGYSLGFNPFQVSDEALKEKTEGLPVVRIRPIGIGSGPADPGGWLWALLSAVGALWLFQKLFTRRNRTG